MRGYSLHKISNASCFGFRPDDYSRFKFGDDAVAGSFGTTLAEGFLQQHRQELQGRQLVVISSPYSFIPTATFALKDHFVYRLNHWLAEHNMPVVQETKVHRTITYREDYGELDAAQRMQLIGNDSFHIDKAFLQGKTLLFLDDIRITGSHERMILKMVEEYGLDNEIYLLYFAELVNPEIHPNIENYLNYHYVNSIFRLDTIIRGGAFRINTRIVKYLLSYEFSSFRIFIQDQSGSFLHQLYNMALGNGYHTIEAYCQNLNFIKNYLFTNNSKLVPHGN